MKKRSFNILGSIAVVNFPDKTKKSDKIKFAGEILKKNKTIKTVLEKSRKFSGRLRKMQTRHLAGEKNNRWKGGITPLVMQIRHCFKYRQWRSDVFTRDDYTCVFCGQRGGKLDPDHIKMFAYHPELRFAIDNGRTLCRKCHDSTKMSAKKMKEVYLTP